MVNQSHIAMPHISVIAPVYKSAACLNELYSRLCATLLKISSDFEILLIEDCGEDGSWELILELAKQDCRVKGIQFSRNFGQHYGISAGLDYCSGDWVVVMDADLQDRPEEILNLYSKAQEGFDVVIARRKDRTDSFGKILMSKLYYKVFNYLADLKHDDETGNFRIISRQVVMNIRQISERLRFFGGLVSWVGFPTAYIDVKHEYRFKGGSSYTFGKLIKLALDIVIAHSDKPLIITVRLGLMISIFSFLYGLYLLFQGLYGNVRVPGWHSIIVSIYFIGGIIVFTLGIVGVYVGKAFDEVKKRPLYVIRKTTFMKKISAEMDIYGH
jgi:dolichol-phosphate mannosyltransferase